MTTGYIMLDTPNLYTPQGGYPRRSGFRPSGTCIVHTSEGNWASGVASLTNLVRTRKDYGCYHRACDWQDIALYYPWEWECWQDSQTNNWAVGIAAACRTTDWSTFPAEIREGYYRNLARMAADFVIYMRDTYGVTVPLRRITGTEARSRVPGFCAHGDSGLNRTDPGAQFDWPKFFTYTKEALEGTTEDDMATPEEIALAVWTFINPNVEGRDAYQILRDIADTKSKMTNLYGTELTLGEQVAHIDKNLNDAREALLAAVEASKTQVVLTPEDVAALAASLKERLAPDVAAELARRLAE